MKSLYLLRHASAADADVGQSDSDRPLAERGQREAAAVGAHLQALAVHRPPTTVLCSTAKRAIETLDGLRPFLPGELEVRYDKSLYNADSAQLLQQISEIDEGDGENALVVAHNPGIAILAYSLASCGDPDLRNRLATRYPPATLAVIDVELERWSDIRETDGILVDFSTPDVE
jgi:phosphohistidine phosphatase